MAFSTLSNVAIRGLVSVVPENTVDNLAVPATNLPGRERLVRNIGIRYRRVCPKGMIFSDLAERAARELLAGIGWSTVDILILITQSPEYPIPSTAIILQDRLGLPKTVLAFDINLGCSGYPYGLFVAASMLTGGGLKRALVIVGDQSASIDSPDDGREVLFSDAASATALEFDASAPPLFFHGASDGSGHKAIYVPHGGKRRPSSAESLEAVLQADGVTRKACDVWLDGPAILNFSTHEAPASVNATLESSNQPIDAIDAFYFHQANRMINETIRKKLRLPPEKTPTTLEQFGNTSSASIPVTMTVASAHTLRAGRQRSLLCGFGVGLSWATMIMESDRIFAPDIIEI